MPRRATTNQLSDTIAGLIKQLQTAQKVVPVLAEQARLEHLELTGRLPTSERGMDCSDEAPPWYSDPVGEKVVSFRPTRDGACDPTEDLQRIAEFLGHAQQLAGATRRLLNNAPAVTLAVVDGRKPTDGRSAEEHAQRKFVRVLSGEPCLIGSLDHEDTDRFGPGQLRRGLCNRHRMAFARWEDQNSMWLFGVDPAERLVRWQMAVFGEIARDPADTKTAGGGGGAYKENLREVA